MRARCAHHFSSMNRPVRANRLCGAVGMPAESVVPEGPTEAARRPALTDAQEEKQACPGRISPSLKATSTRPLKRDRASTVDSAAVRWWHGPRKAMATRSARCSNDVSSRRGLLKTGLVLTSALALGPELTTGTVRSADASPVAAPADAPTQQGPRLSFTAIKPDTSDTLTVAEGYTSQVLLSWGDPLFPDVGAVQHQRPECRRAGAAVRLQQRLRAVHAAAVRLRQHL